MFWNQTSREKILKRGTVLAHTLPGARFSEWQHGVIDVPIDEVWTRLHALRWADLRLTRVFLLARGFGLGGLLEKGCLDTFAPVAVFVENEPVEVAFAMVGQPWSPLPRSRCMRDLAEVAGFEEPGWLKYGMDWRLTALSGSRTLVETTTLCEPTDRGAERRFAAYWR